MDIGFHHGPFAFRLDAGFHFSSGFFHSFLNAGRVDAAVGNELLQRQPGDFPADRVEARQGDGLRGVVDNQIHAGQGFQSPDIPAFPADNAALHFIAGQGHHRNGGLAHMVRGAAGNGHRNHFPCLFLCLVLELLLKVCDFHRFLVGQLPFQAFQKLFLGLAGCQARNAFQLVDLAFLKLFRFLQPFLNLKVLLLDAFLFFLQVIQLAVQGFLFLLDSALLPGNFGAAVLNVPFRLGAQLMDFFLCLYQQFFFLCFGRFICLVDDPLCLILSASNFGFGCLFAIGDADEKSRGARHNQCDKKSDSAVDNCTAVHTDSNPPFFLFSGII